MTRREASLLGVQRWRDIKASRIDDYLFIGGHRMPDHIAAERIGVTERTIQRYRAELRQQRRLP